MKIALCQTNMHWTIEENVQNIKDWIVESTNKGADLVLFTECAITGYHRQIPKITNTEALKKAHQAILDCVIEQDIPVILGTPFIADDMPDKIFNSALLLDPKQKGIQITSKIGLTDTELQYFSAGTTRKTFKVGNKHIGLIFCREILDKDELIQDYKEANLDLLVWPSYIKWDERSDAPDYIGRAHYMSISKALTTPIINVNAANSLNDPSLSGLGGSLYLKEGAVLYQAPKDKAVLKLIELG